MNFKTFALAAGLLAASPLLVAQTTTTVTSKTVTAEVVAVHGQKLIYKKDGKILEAQIPEGTRFDMAGKQVTLGELEPGTTVTATITTVTKEIAPEKIVTLKNAEVVHIAGRVAILKYENGEFKKHTVPSDFPIYVDGKKTNISKVKKGMKISATFTEVVPGVTMTETQIAAMATAPEKVAPIPVAEPAKVAAPAALPKTGSHVALFGLLGIFSLGAGAGLRTLRRRS